MPLYEFECQKCENVFEKLVMNYNNKTVAQCPECLSKITKKIISNSTFKIKGYSESNGYCKKNMSADDVIKAGPNKSIENLQHSLK